jgi:hypothetical protein
MIAVELAVEAISHWQVWRVRRRQQAQGFEGAALPTAEDAVRWIRRRFRLGRRGTLARMCSEDADLAGLVYKLIHARLHQAVRHRAHSLFAGQPWRREQDCDEVAREILVAKVHTICARYDPSAGDFAAYVGSFAQLGSLTLEARAALGLLDADIPLDMLTEEPVADDAFRSPEPHAGAPERRLPADCPDHIRLHVDGRSDVEIGQLLNIRPASVQRKRKRWIDRMRHMFGSGDSDEPRRDPADPDAVPPKEEGTG